MGYNFQGSGVNKMRLGVYVVVLLVFLLSASFLISGKSVAKEESSGYIVARQEDDTVKVSGVNQIDEVQKQLDKLKTNIDVFSANLTTCYQDTADLSIQAQTCSRDFTACKADFAKLSANKTVAEQTCLNEKTSLQLALTSSEAKSGETNKTLSALASGYDELKKNYDSLAGNSANNICCKSRVDNPKIRYYKIENNKVACSEDTGTTLNC